MTAYTRSVVLEVLQDLATGYSAAEAVQHAADRHGLPARDVLHAVRVLQRSVRR